MKGFDYQTENKPTARVPAQSAIIRAFGHRRAYAFQDFGEVRAPCNGSPERQRGTVILEQRRNEMFLRPIGIGVKKVRQILNQAVSNEQSAPTIGGNQSVAHLAQLTTVKKRL